MFCKGKTLFKRFFFSQGRGNFKKRPSRVSTIMHHAYLNVTSFVCNIDEKCQVFFSIYDAREGRFIRSVDNKNLL